MEFFHVTSAKNASAIEGKGFKDSRGYFMTDSKLKGVWNSDRPLDCNDMGTIIKDPAVFEIEIEESLVQPYEFNDERTSYREWLVPAAILNASRYRRIE